jgi:hypothetical protein
VERLAILPIDASKTKEIECAITAERRVTMPSNGPTLLVNAEPGSQGNGESTFGRLKTRIWMTVTWRTGFSKIEVMVESFMLLG